ncbi:hypothetical protein LEP1GSC041_2679 [Leptospira noguchii str. 2006001870]|nr:hypothetical protein LEP1GSC041_2679 [Leptospira noguchii str. 2006001870]
MCSTILETKASRFYWRSGNSASHSPWIVRETQRLASIGARETQRLASIGARETQRLASIGARGNSASHSPWIVRETQRLASIGARRDTKVKIIILRMFKFIFPIKAERK